MIYSLSGTIVDVTKESVAIETGNIAYEVLVSRPFEYRKEDRTRLLTVEIITQDDHYLVGFSTKIEKEAFLSLTSVKGIGPKTALSALSKTTPDELFGAIENSNVSYLKKLPGIGPKAASQIVLDLKGKLAIEESKEKEGKALSPVAEEVKAALKSLGFKAKDIDPVLATFKDETYTRDDLLKACLRKLRNR